MSDGIWRALTTWIHGGSTLIALACDVAVLVAIATIVRRNRPDAYQRLQVWAIATLAVFVLTTIGWLVVPYVARTDGSMEGYFRATALLSILGTVLHVALVILFIRGITALAQPPKPIVVEGIPPYR